MGEAIFVSLEIQFSHQHNIFLCAYTLMYSLIHTHSCFFLCSLYTAHKCSTDKNWRLNNELAKKWKDCLFIDKQYMYVHDFMLRNQTFLW